MTFAPLLEACLTYPPVTLSSCLMSVWLCICSSLLLRCPLPFLFPWEPPIYTSKPSLGIISSMKPFLKLPTPSCKMPRSAISFLFTVKPQLLPWKWYFRLIYLLFFLLRARRAFCLYTPVPQTELGIYSRCSINISKINLRSPLRLKL